MWTSSFKWKLNSKNSHFCSKTTYGREIKSFVCRTNNLGSDEIYFVPKCLFDEEFCNFNLVYFIDIYQWSTPMAVMISFFGHKMGMQVSSILYDEYIKTTNLNY